MNLSGQQNVYDYSRSHGSCGCGCGGDGQCNFVSGLIEEKREELNSDFIIGAGAYFVDIQNEGLTPIFVNGEKVSPGGQWHSKQQINHVNQIQDFVGQVIIQANSKYWYKAAYPSSTNPNSCGYGTGIQNQMRYERINANTTIPSGAYYVDVQNEGLTPITVNGQIVSPGGQWHSENQVNNLTSVQDFVGEVNIISPNGKYWLMASFPSGMQVPSF